MNIATEFNCCKCDAMPCSYVETLIDKPTASLLRKYYCGFHLRELEEQ